MKRAALPFVALFAGLSFAGPARSADPCADHAPQVRPQNAGRDVVGRDLDELVEQGHMLFAVYEDYAPYSWEEAGEPRGVDIDIARLIAAEIGVEAQFNFVQAGESLDADLLNNIWKGAAIGGRISNVMMRVPYNPSFACRAEQVVFTGQYATESIAIAYSKEAYPEDKPVPAYFRYDSVAVENDSISDFYLTSFAGGQLSGNVMRFHDTLQAVEAVADGRAKAAMGPRSQLEYGASEAVGVHQPPLAGFAVSRWTLGVAVNFRYRPLAYAVDDAIAAALADGRIETIFASYGLTFQPPER